MNGCLRSGVIVSLVLSMIFVGSLTAESYVYDRSGYSFTYSSAAELAWIRSVYTPEAWNVAYRVLGKNYLTSRIPVSFYNDPTDPADGWGGSTIRINTYRCTTAATFGSILAHETSHCLFNAYVKISYWNLSGNLKYYYSMLTEALAYFTNEVAYAYGSQYSDSTIKYNISYYKTLSGGTNQTWYGSGYYYKSYFESGSSVSSNTFWQAWWQLHGIGYFLTGGNTTSTSSTLKTLLDNLHWRANYSQLGSSDYATARAQFEKCFLKTYGKYANAGAELGGWTNTRYLSGDFNLLWQY